MKQKSNEYLDLGGTIRSCSAEKTLLRVNPLLKSFGITRIANVTGLDCIGIPVAVCIRPNSKHISVSQGKGATLELAKASAVMESIESYHAENPPKPAFFGSFSELSKDYALINPNKFPSEFLSHDDIENYQLNWTEGKNLINEEKIYLPHILTCLDSSQPHPEYALLSVDSNGLASGNTHDEAVCHALYELIERDALYRWGKLSDEEKSKTQISLETINSEINQNFISRFIKAGIKVIVWDIASMFGIPAYRCAIVDSDVLRSLGVFYGSGAHLSKEIALSRALTEAAQSRLTLISGSRDDIFPDYYKKHHSEETIFEVKDGTLDFKECVSPKLKNSFSENINEILNKIKSKGFNEIIVVDHTKEEYKIPVVQVFVIGFQNNGSRL